MTLQALIDQYQARQPMPEPIRRAVALTVRGDAVVSVMRLRRQLVDLNPTDREYVRGLLAEMVTVLAADLIA